MTFPSDRSRAAARFSFTLSAMLAFVLLAAPAAAQEAETEEPLWTGGAGVSYLATSGNADSESFGVDVDIKRRPTPWGLEILAKFHRAKDSGDLTAERYSAGLRARREMSERWDVFAGFSGEKDEFSDVDLRLIAEAGVVYKALLGPTHLLDLDLGLTWTDEQRVAPEPSTESFGALLGLRYEWQISETSSFAQRVLYYPNFDASSDWRAEAHTTLTTALTERFALSFSYELRYRNEPIGDNDDTDTTTKASLVWSL